MRFARHTCNIHDWYIVSTVITQPTVTSNFFSTQFCRQVVNFVQKPRKLVESYSQPNCERYLPQKCPAIRYTMYVCVHTCNSVLTFCLFVHGAVGQQRQSTHQVFQGQSLLSPSEPTIQLLWGATTEWSGTHDITGIFSLHVVVRVGICFQDQVTI